MLGIDERMEKII